ncbi:hypothetical protein GCM10010327_05270 [Streptomyces nitrosporeus]|nr:hypothetical protein GCM10010327_05270 [Streptomyces nitrosporeus]
MPMKVGSIFAYELTQSIATNGAMRHRAITTLMGVTVGGFASFSSGIWLSVPSSIACGNAQEI